MESDLGKLMKEIRNLFKAHITKYPIHMFSLVCWQDGYWSIEVTDNWHKWLRNHIEESKLRYNTPELACKKFLEYVKKNKINIKKLQGD